MSYCEFCDDGLDCVTHTPGRRLAHLVMQMIEGNTAAYEEASDLVEKHFPDVYQVYV